MASNQRVAGAYVDLELSLAKFKASINEANGVMGKFRQQMKADMESSRGAVRILNEELGLHMPRALQTVITKLPGVASAMSAAFNAIAVIGLISIVVQAGEKIGEFVKKNQDAAKQNADAWRGITQPLVESNDSLRVQNDKIEEAIQKLEHKPVNGIKTAIDEAVASADKLSGKLTEDLSKIQNVIKSSAPGFVSQLFGEADTQDLQNKYAALQARLLDANTAGDKAVRAAQNSPGSEADRKSSVDKAKQAWQDALNPIFADGAKTFSDALRKALDEDKSQRANAAKYGLDPKNLNTGLSGQISTASALSEYFSGQQTALQLNATNDKDTSQLKLLQDGQQAAQDLLKQFEQAMEQRKALESVSLSNEASYWNSKLKVFKQGSEQYMAVLTHVVQANNAEQKFLAQSLKDYRDRTGPAPTLLDNKGSDQQQEAIAKGIEQQAQLRAQVEQTRIAFNLATGAITPHDAAIAEAANHSQEYADKLKALNAQLAKLKAEQFTGADGKNLDDQNAAKQQNVTNQINDLNGKYQLQRITDAQATLSTTWTGMIDSVFDELIKKSQDTTGAIKADTQQLIQSINNELAKSLTGQKTDWKKTLQGSADSFTKTGIQKAEGVGLSLLGFGGGKRDGSSAQAALFVQMAGSGASPDIASTLGLFGKSSSPNVTGPGGAGVGAAAGAATKGLLGFLNDNNFASSLFGGNLFGSGSLLGGHMAGGGSVMAGVPYEVGDAGREVFTPSVPGHITPNSGLRGHTYNIDARGTDPVQTQMAVGRAIASSSRQSVAAATHTVSEHQKRTPQ